MEKIADPPGPTSESQPFWCGRVETESATRRYSNILCDRHTDSVKLMSARGFEASGAMIVINVFEDLTPNGEKQLLVARAAGVTRLAVYLNRRDGLTDDDRELFMFLTTDIKERIQRMQYRDVIFVEGSAAEAAAASPSPESTASIVRLVQALDRLFAP